MVVIPQLSAPDLTPVSPVQYPPPIPPVEDDYGSDSDTSQESAQDYPIARPCGLFGRMKMASEMESQREGSSCGEGEMDQVVVNWMRIA